jgi:hypothetical protein
MEQYAQKVIDSAGIVRDAILRQSSSKGAVWRCLPAYTSWMDRHASESERQRAKEIAAAVLDGRTTVLKAVRELCPLAHTDALANEEDRTLVIAIESETDDLPIGEVRKLWAPYALKAKDAEIVRAEELYKAQFLEACKRIAEPSQSHQ